MSEEARRGQRADATSAPVEGLEHGACAVCAQGSASEVAGAGADQAKKDFSRFHFNPLSLSGATASLVGGLTGRLAELRGLTPGREHNLTQRLARPRGRFGIKKLCVGQSRGFTLIAEGHDRTEVKFVRNLEGFASYALVIPCHLVRGKAEPRSL